jgi:hypothetical protein
MSDVKVKSQAKLKGDLISGGHVELVGQAEVEETVYAKDGVDVRGSGSVGDKQNSIPGMPDVEPTQEMIGGRHSRIASTGVSSGPTIDDIEGADCGSASSSSCTLEDGKYHLEKINLNDEGELILQPNGKTIQIAVEDYIDLGSDSTIRVDGPGRVHIFNKGDLDIRSQSAILTPGKDATQLWVWQDKDTVSTLHAQTTFSGVLYAGTEGEVTVNPNDNGAIYGAIVGDFQGGIGADRPLRYDRALRDVDPFETDNGKSGDTIAYLQLSKRTISVD